MTTRQNFATGIEIYFKVRRKDPEDDTTFANNGTVLFGESEDHNPCTMGFAREQVWRKTGLALYNIENYFERRHDDERARVNTQGLANAMNSFFRSFEFVVPRETIHFNTSTRDLRAAVKIFGAEMQREIISDFQTYLGRNGRLLSINSFEILQHSDYVNLAANVITSAAVWNEFSRAWSAPSGERGATVGLSQVDLQEIAAFKDLNSLMANKRLAPLASDRAVIDGLWYFAQTVVKVDERVGDYNTLLSKTGTDRMPSFFAALDAADHRADGYVTRAGLLNFMAEGSRNWTSMPQLQLGNFM